MMNKWIWGVAGLLILSLLTSVGWVQPRGVPAAGPGEANPNAFGPGGVGPDLSLWLKADAITGLGSGDLVNVWSDSSGNGFDLTALDNLRSPTWQSGSGSVINGFPVVAFDGTNDFLSEPSGTPRNSNFTAFAVVRLAGVSDNDGIWLSVPGGADAVDIKLRTSGGCAGQYTLSTVITATTYELCAGAFSFVSPSLLAFSYDNGVFDSWQNGAFVSTLSVPSSWLADLGQYTVGIDRTQSDYFHGNLAELAVYTGYLNSAQRRIVENYLAAKYDLSLAAGDQYDGDSAGNGDFDYDVIGIGKESDGSHLEAGAVGLALNASAAALGQGEYVLAGHRVQNNTVVTSSLPSGVDARWEREWYVDGGGQTITMTFNAVDAGVAYIGGDYKLLYRANDGVAFSIVGATPVESGDNIAFAHVATDGLYTLGIGDIDASTIGAIRVSSTLDTVSSSDGVCTLREAIDSANDDTASGAQTGECNAGSGADTILLPEGIYTLSLGGAGENLNQTGDLDIRDVLQIIGDGAETTIIQGANSAGTASDRVIDVRLSTSVTLRDLTVRYGVAPSNPHSPDGGGIRNTGHLDLTGVHLIQNHAHDGNNGFNGNNGGRGGDGGAIYSTGPLTITRSLLSNNQAGYGGRGADGVDGLGCDEPAGNGGRGGNGGAIAAEQGSLWLVESTLDGNWAGDGGAGGDESIFCSPGHGTDGGGGGAIHADNLATPLIVMNSTLSGNGSGYGGAGGLGTSGDGDGGDGGDGAGLQQVVGTSGALLLNVTVYGNQIGLGGFPNGLPGDGALDSGSGLITSRNSIVSNTAGGDCLGVFGGDGNLIDDHSSGPCSGISSAAVTLLDGTLTDNGGPTPTHAVDPGSNAVDAGVLGCPDALGGTLTTDQRGYARPYGADCDVGAYEYVELVTMDDTHTVPSNTLLRVAAPGLLANDPDFTSGVTVVGTGGDFSATDHGLINLASDGGFAYYPDLDFVGEDVVDITITDGAVFGQSLLTITVSTAPNEPPLAVDDVYVVLEDNELVVSDPGVLSNDISDDALVAGLEQDASSGLLALAPGGGFTYSPTLNFYGVMSFTYRVTDTIGQTDTAVSYILVSPVNDPPQVAPDAYLLEANTPLSPVNGVLDNDVDPEGNELLATLVTDVPTGTLSLNLDGSFRYTPTLGFSGVVTFTYEATDGEDTAQSVAKLYVDVLQVTVGAGGDTFTWLPGLELHGSLSPYSDFTFLDDDGDYTDTSGETRYYQLVDPQSGILKWFGIFRFDVTPGQ